MHVSTYISYVNNTQNNPPTITGILPVTTQLLVKLNFIRLPYLSVYFNCRLHLNFTAADTDYTARHIAKDGNVMSKLDLTVKCIVAAFKFWTVEGSKWRS